MQIASRQVWVAKCLATNSAEKLFLEYTLEAFVGRGALEGQLLAGRSAFLVQTLSSRPFLQTFPPRLACIEQP